MIKTDAVIIGAGPVGLFAVFELGILGLNAHVIDNLDRAGGQCIELYPDKPIYDIPAVPDCTGESLTDNLLKQIKPFKTNFHFNQRVDKLEKKNENWLVTTNDAKQFETPNIIIAAGVGSFEPRKPPIKNIDRFEKTNLFYAVKDKNKFKDQTVCIFGGGDSALDWTVELSKIAKKIILIHRREEFRAAHHTVTLAKDLEKKGKVEILTCYQPTDFEGDKSINNVKIKHDNGDQRDLKVDSVLAFLV
jgi:thioredoxin reductase (NADPH)